MPAVGKPSFRHHTMNMTELLATRRLRRSATAFLILSVLLASSVVTNAGAQPLDPLAAVVGIRASVPPDARTAPHLGTEREGSGVVIDDGMVLTIGYLILEADRVEILSAGDRRVPAEIVAYDYDTGFGLVRALAPLNLAPIKLGRSTDVDESTQVLVAGFGQPPEVVAALVVSRRTFAGYWEYLLPDAIFTAPPHPGFGGAALIGRDGTLLGIGSLIVGDAAAEDEQLPGNMFVPIDALKPIYDQLLSDGRSRTAPKPWLGIYSEEFRGHVLVTRVAPGGPADQAGINANDVIAEVNGKPIGNLEEFYREIWSLGEAGIEVPLTVLGAGGLAKVTVTSADRYDWLKLGRSY